MNRVAVCNKLLPILEIINIGLYFKTPLQFNIDTEF